MLSCEHTLSKWPSRTIEQVKSTIGTEVTDHDILELLDMADGNVNRAINMYLNQHQSEPVGNTPPRHKSFQFQLPNGVKPGNKISVNLPDGRKLQITVPNGMKAGNTMKINYDEKPPPPPQATNIPIATPIASPPIAIGSSEPPPPPSAPPIPSETKSSSKGAHSMIFKVRSYEANAEYGFPENVTISLEGGHFTVLDDDNDDLASWPMAHVHDWSATGKHDIEIHVPEGTLEFGIEDAEAFLTKLSILHSALSGH